MKKEYRFTAKQQKFITAYCSGLTATDAAVQAGYAPTRAGITAQRLLQHEHIKEKIHHNTMLAQQTQHEAKPLNENAQVDVISNPESTFCQRTMPESPSDTPSFYLSTQEPSHTVTNEAVVQELAAIGFASIHDICHWSDNGVTLYDATTLSRHMACAVAEVKESSTARGGVQIKMHSKLKALELLGRHLGMFSAISCNGDEELIPELPEALRQKIKEVYGSSLLPAYTTHDDERDAT